MNDPSFLVTIDSDTEWNYNNYNIYGGSLSVEFDTSTSYTTTISPADSRPTTESGTTASAASTVTLTVQNATTESQTVIIGASRASMSIPLAPDADIVVVSAIGTIGSSSTLSCSITDNDDPTFTLKPAKPPPQSTSHQTPTPTITWDGSGWSPSDAIANSGGTLRVENDSAATVSLILANDTVASDASTLTTDLGANTSVDIEFGSGYTLAAGQLSIGTTSAGLVVTP